MSKTKPKMDLNEWKRVYSNEPVETAKEWLMQNFDENFFSLYYVKYTESLPPLDFMKSNLVNGYYQSFEGKMHKIAFASCLIGENVEFIWLFQGKEIPTEMKESSLYECSEWSEINLDQALDYIFPAPKDGEPFVFK